MEALKAAAARRIVQGQGELDLGFDAVASVQPRVTEQRVGEEMLYGHREMDGRGSTSSVSSRRCCGFANRPTTRPTDRYSESPSIQAERHPASNGGCRSGCTN